jgi:hypothetical protein
MEHHPGEDGTSVQDFSPAAPIGKYLSCSPADIDWALTVQADESAAGNAKRLGEILVEREMITPEELTAALNAQCIHRLRRCPILSGLPAAEIDRIGAIAEEVRLAEGEGLLKEGQRGDSMYVVVSGEIMIYQGHEDSKRTTLGIAQPGNVLGEMGYFSDGTRAYSACARQPAVVLRIRYDLLRDNLRNMPALALEFLNLITRRIREENVRFPYSLNAS